MGTAGNGSPVGGTGGGSPGKLVATLVAAVGDAHVRGDRAGGNIHESADTGGHFPVLGFVGDWFRRLRGGMERE